MEGDYPSNVFPQNQHALSDITNCLGKRGLPLISGNTGNKIVDDKEAISQNTKRVCQGAEVIVKKKCTARSVGNEYDKNKSACVSPRPCSEINFLRGNVISAGSKISSEIKESDNVISLQIGINSAVTDDVVKVDEVTGDSCDILLPIGTGMNCRANEYHDKDDEQDTLNVVEGCSQTGESVTEIFGKDIEGIHVGNLTTEKLGIVDFSVGPESHVPGFNLEKCKGPLGDSCSNPSAGINLLKSCSCSFCMKAAYIWSDLHYQDIKGRISAIKKSQKEAKIMKERSCMNTGIDRQSQGNYSDTSKLELDLSGQWRSLFLHMENVFEREGNQLETSLLSLKDLRDNCKTELELINGMPMEKH